MDVLKRLFEQHYQVPAEHVKPLQGQLGGSGRAIIRLSGGGRSAIGILYPIREENVAFLEFSGTGNPCRRKCLENSRKATFSSRMGYRMPIALLPPPLSRMMARPEPPS